MICEIVKRFRGGSWTMYARLPKGMRLSKEEWRRQFEFWGESTNGGHEEGYRMYAKGVRKVPEGAEWLEFDEDILLRHSAGRAKASRSSRSRAQSRASGAAIAVKRVRVPTGSGTHPQGDVEAWLKPAEVGSNACNMPKFLPVPSKNGLPRRRSAAAVVPRSSISSAKNLPGLYATNNTVTSLACLLLGLLGNTYSGDQVALASYAARNMATAFGVDPDEFERVRQVIVAKWLRIDATDPFHKMFSAGRDPDIK